MTKASTAKFTDRMLTLRPYQTALRDDVYQAWNQGAQNVVMRLPTGGGKTAILAHINNELPGSKCIIAHRNELVEQISLALARKGLYHRIIASETNAHAIAREHVAEFGRSFYNPNAPVAVASVDTLVRAEGLESWARGVTLWTVDEAHHLIHGNKWDRATSLFTHPQCRGLMPTATPCRADGKGLGRPALGGHGFADVMVYGPSERWLIEQGFLCDFDVACPPSDFQMIEDLGSSGDWTPKQLRAAVKRSHIVGDVVATYLKLAAGRLGVTFATDIETAGEISLAYNAAGVRAEVLTGKTDGGARRSILARYKRREITQLVVVDIVSEGFDIPAMEVASSIRKTESLALYMQQFGRVLRPMEGKAKALWIDHVGNVVCHGGTPDYPRQWTLASRIGSSRGKSDAIPMRVCDECWKPYYRTETECPFCGAPIPEPATSSAPEQVDGDLVLLDPVTLDKLRGRMIEANETPSEYGLRLAAAGSPLIGVKAGQNRRQLDLLARAELSVYMDQWGGRLHAAGRTDRQIQREFFHTFGLDVLTARSLKRDESEALSQRIKDKLS